jgi:hypothetical protein
MKYAPPPDLLAGLIEDQIVVAEGEKKSRKGRPFRLLFFLEIPFCAQCIKMQGEVVQYDYNKML